MVIGYRCALPRPKGWEIDITIAACATVREGGLWTLNFEDFEDIPDLKLWRGWNEQTA
jgi:predicted nucleic acid-binding protein